MKSSTQFVKGTLILAFANLLCRFLGFFYKIFLAQALGAEGMGIYQLIFPVFSVCHALTASGIETAISRFNRFQEGGWRILSVRRSLHLSCYLLSDRSGTVAGRCIYLRPSAA